jgi:hypothetical protein
MKNLLVISAKKRCGKDTVAKMVRDIIGEGNTVSYALAEPIKRALWYGLKFAHVRNPLNREVITIDNINGLNKFDREMDLNLSSYQLASVLKTAWGEVEAMRGELGVHTMDALGLIDNQVASEDKVWSIRRLMQVFGTDICVAVNQMIWMKFMADHYLDAIAENKLMIITDCRQEHEMKALRMMGGTFWFVNRDLPELNTDTHITERGLQPKITDVVIDNNGTLEELSQNVYGLFL